MAGLGSGPMQPQWGGPSQGGGWNGTSFGVQAPAPPPGYEWDPLTGAYGRTPTAAGQRVGQAQTGAYQAGPLSGLLAAGGQGGSGGGGGGGAPGTQASNTPTPTVGWPGSGFPGEAMGPGSGSGGGAPPPVSSSGGGGSSSGTDVSSKAFATAKDAVGQQARGATNSLNDELAAQGLSGSGAQVQGTKDIIQSGAEQLASTSSDLAKTSAQNAITTRGQDIGASEAQYSGQIQQRGQDIQAQQAIADNALKKQLASMGLLQQAMQGLTGAGASFQY
jgi:hypothetical protein